MVPVFLLRLSLESRTALTCRNGPSPCLLCPNGSARATRLARFNRFQPLGPVVHRAAFGAETSAVRRVRQLALLLLCRMPLSASISSYSQSSLLSTVIQKYSQLRAVFQYSACSLLRCIMCMSRLTLRHNVPPITSTCSYDTQSSLQLRGLTQIGHTCLYNVFMDSAGVASNRFLVTFGAIVKGWT